MNVKTLSGVCESIFLSCSLTRSHGVTRTIYQLAICFKFHLYKNQVIDIIKLKLCYVMSLFWVSLIVFTVLNRYFLFGCCE